MKKLSLAIVAAATVAAASPAMAADNLLKNGSFENGLTFWNQTSAVASGFQSTNGNRGVTTVDYRNGVTPFNNPITADNAMGNRSSDAAGNFAAYFVDDQARQTLSQTLTLAAGVYDIGFDYYQVATGNSGPFTLDVAFGNQGVASATSASTSPAGTWYNTSTRFTAATAGQYTFNFVYTSGAAPANDALVDRVYVAAVPEPATWGMMVLGFGAVGFAARRRSKVAGRVVAA